MSDSREQLLAWKAEGWCWVEVHGDGQPQELIWWPFCIVDGCTNRRCLRLNSPRCYPHTLPGVPIMPEIEEAETC